MELIFSILKIFNEFEFLTIREGRRYVIAADALNQFIVTQVSKKADYNN